MHKERSSIINRVRRQGMKTGFFTLTWLKISLSLGFFLVVFVEMQFYGSFAGVDSSVIDLSSESKPWYTSVINARGGSILLSLVIGWVTGFLIEKRNVSKKSK